MVQEKTLGWARKTDSDSESQSSSEGSNEKLSGLSDLSFDLDCFDFDSRDNRAKKFPLTVVSQCVEKLKLMQSVTLPHAEAFKVSNWDYKSLETRFGQSKEQDYMNKRISAEYTDFHKLQKDLSVALSLLKSLLEEVNLFSTFNNVNDQMENIIRMRREELDLIKKVRHKQHVVKHLKSLLAGEKESSGQVLQEYKNLIPETYGKYRSGQEEEQAKIRYVRQWQNARYEQNFLKLKNVENAYLFTTQSMQRGIDLENRCHQELEDYLLEAYQDGVDNTEKWMENYETTLESKESEILKMRIKCDRLSEDIEKIKKTYEEREQEMKDWLGHKWKKKVQGRIEAGRIRAAIKIQVWWRSYLARRKLKKKGKKGKKSKKGKK